MATARLLHEFRTAMEIAVYLNRPLLLALALFALNACGGVPGGSAARAVPNQLPRADAGTAFTVDEGAVARLSGSGSDVDGDVIAFEWTQVSGAAVTLVGANRANPSFTAPQVSGNQTLVFRLVVTDDDLARSPPSTVSITVRDTGGNLVPTANAGPDQTVDSGASTILSGSGADADGAVAGFQWTQAEGPVVTLIDGNTATARFTAPTVSTETSLVFRLTVTDDQGATGFDLVTVTVRAGDPSLNQPPQAFAGEDRSVAEGEAATLAGRGEDPDGSIAGYAWAQLSGPAVALTGANTSTLQFTAPQVDSVTRLDFRLVVTDNRGGTASDDVRVYVLDRGSALSVSPLVASDTAIRGCDPLDSSACLYPFPSNHYTVELGDAAAARARNIHTGRRVNFNLLAMPRNVAGKPIDPTEWNRNDGFSPGTLIATYVPGLDRAGLLRTFGFTPRGDADQDNRVGITNPQITTRADSPIQVINADTGERHPVWVEMDVNADDLLPATNELQGFSIPRPQAGRSSLILRPARNFTPGQRYIVILSGLLDKDGNKLSPGPAFRTCLASTDSPLPPIKARCDALARDVLRKIPASIPLDQLYLAWDFTVASAQNLTARLTHMHDDAFKSLATGSQDCARYDYPGEPMDLRGVANGAVGGCRSPQFTVDRVEAVDDGNVIQIQGTLKVPSYLQQPDPSPLEKAEFQALLDRLRDVPGAGALFDNDLFFTAQPFNLVPPNRLHYSPLDGGVPSADLNALSLLPYGDGLPDRVPGVGEMTTRYLCEVKRSVYEGTEAPARPGLYGHGLLQSRAGLTYDEGRRMVKRNNFFLCGLDWFGFSQGDLHNVVISLLDMSNFPTIPDASMQGMLNFMFMARVMQHPAGLASHPAFQRHADGQPSGVPFFDRSEIYYYGNSQGGILPGPVVAVSKDINRGVFGVPGMNYSTLLRRSTDFVLYSIPLYLSYQDELDRVMVFGLVQMIWDRSENNAYAAYLTRNNAAIHGGLPGNANLDGQDNYVLLHPAFSDHQVSYWTADVMARTMDAKSDRQQIGSPFCEAGGIGCDPDLIASYLLPPVDYVDGKALPGPVEVVWNARNVKAPPLTERPPSNAEHGPDPHGFPRNNAAALCQTSHFLRTDAQLVDVFSLWRDAKSESETLADCNMMFGNRIPATLAKPGVGAAP